MQEMSRSWQLASQLFQRARCIQHLMHRVAARVQVLVKGSWIGGLSVLRIAGHEPSRERVIVSGAEVVEAEVLVVLFAAIEIVARRSS